VNHSSDTAVNLMILWTINTGVVTAITSVVILTIVGYGSLTFSFTVAYLECFN